MLKDNRPYFVKKLYVRLERLYANRIMRPQFERLGKYFTFIKPWHMELFGSPIVVGDFSNIIARSDSTVRIAVWSDLENPGGIRIGDYCLICPGVRISCASDISIGHNCMMANRAYITDSDWHGHYNRIIPGAPSPVRLEDNVWVGDGAIVCKGVTIGKNSIIGAGAVVAGDVPPNTVSAGNPARVVKHLDPDEAFVTRSRFFSNPDALFKGFDGVDLEMLKENTFFNWIRTLLFPRRGD
ncbi:MAG: acyltransferase [Desulfobacterales bacterium]|nr:acyltransferase [Desulfobacterales bacterium]